MVHGYWILMTVPNQSWQLSELVAYGDTAINTGYDKYQRKTETHNISSKGDIELNHPSENNPNP